MSNRVAAIATAVALALVALGAGALLPVALRDSGSGAATVDPASALLPTADATERIAALEERRDAGDATSVELASLGLAYLSHARNAAEPASLSAADAAFRESLAAEPDDNFEAFVGLAALANARHDFSGSLAWARKAITLNPYNAAPYGLLGDALFELGRVRAADRAYQDMVDIRPDMASYVRASYALGFHGDTDGALGTLRLALQASASATDVAWVRHQLGDVYGGSGRFELAARENRIGMKVAPDYAPPKVGLAESLIARGRLDEAIPLVEAAIEELPALEYQMTLGELYEAAGRDEAARVQYRRAADVLADYRANGMLPDADLILFYVDHGFRMIAALEEARAIYADRPTAKTADALAWALHRNGRSAGASRYARAALEEAPNDAGYLFHAGMIRRALGDRAQARALLRRALGSDPAFSVLQAPVARSLLAR